jgi:hypothetical protein
MRHDATLLQALERIEIAFRASKPHILMQDAIVLYKAIKEAQNARTQNVRNTDVHSG